MICAGCQTDFKDSCCLTCNACKSIFCYECLNIDKDCIPNLNKNRLAALKCPSCANITQRNNKDNTPIQGNRNKKPADANAGMSTPTQGTRNKKPADANAGMSSATLPTTHTEPHILSSGSQTLTLDSISRLLDQKLAPTSSFVVSMREALKDDIKSLVMNEFNSEINRIEVEFTNTTDFLTQELTDVKNKVATRDNKVEELEMENTRLQSEMKHLHARLAAVEKISRDHNIEIQGVPETRSENLLEILKNMLEVISTPIADSDIRSFRRVTKVDPKSERPRNIIVTLASPRLRDLVLSATYRFNKSHPKDMINTRHLGVSGESRRIYVVEHISPETKQIHAAARKFACDNNYKFVWVKYGSVFIRENESSKPVRVRSVESLQDLPQKS